jgi:hypothetical protein
LNPLKPGLYEYNNHIFDYEPFYVGIGRKNRLFGHISEAKNTNKNTYKLNTIRKILKNNLTPIIIKYKENLSNIEAQQFEIEIISSIGRYDLKTGPLTNLTCGGELNTISFSNKLKKQISNSLRERWKNQTYFQKMCHIRKNLYINGNETVNIISIQRIFTLLNDIQEKLKNTITS